MLLAFEPTTLAIMACALCRPNHIATIPRARVWLRRYSESIFDTLIQEATEPLLDMANVIDPRVLLASVMLLIFLRAVMHQRK